ncbi:oligopeptide transport system ATP-binding protein [Dethiosulfatibacter aminovorans DSM 17477]|uniref:Oligopeptide transport system ATP-binding protein n=1 Tax=Dethiosulfatibacter aminovorans DSM 17477 TaxID=1121476 RepID=A0A1M6BLI9_9FIRM|nr:dipeptide ABC transporter ATP-binding protein [Dethiosulfatibacter aminovorans]SHI49383.1 oligopeptide transport system ATP-binding protein [Dethiosulfatibacter aminovorans DSM 17477]
MDNTVLKIDNLSKNFKIKGTRLFEKPKILKAVNDVSFEVYEGETLGVIGESGCGKSTLGKCIIQLHNPSSGEIIYNDDVINKLKHSELKGIRKDIQIIFQDPYSSLDPRKTIGSIIEEPMIIHNIGTPSERKKKVIELLKEVGLDTFHVNRYPHEFSGGQRQRINVARALALNPKVIVCDEPVSALDVSVQAQVLNLMKNLQKKFNLTYIFISHDLSVVKYISDRIAIMYLGKIVELGNAKDIYSAPKHPYTKALFSAIPPESPFDRKERFELIGDIPSPLNLPAGCPLSTRCPKCMDICTRKMPELKSIKGKHKVSCFLYE